MSNQSVFGRRAAVKGAAASILGLPWFGATALSAADAGPIGRGQVLKLGVASYSLNKLSSTEVITALQELGIRNIGAFRGHINWRGTADECRAAARQFQEAGIAVTGSSVIDLPNDEVALRKAFDNARAAGLPVMVSKPAKDAFGLLEKFVAEFDIKIAIHNHGPEDKEYPSPYDAWDIIQRYDRRIGLCIDMGHAARAGTNPVEAILKCRERLYDVHLKDTLAPVGAKDDVPVEVGRGNIDIRAILSALIEIKYLHVVEFEYERKSANPVIGLAESIGYVRGLLAGMTK